MGNAWDGDERQLPFSHRPRKRSETRQQQEILTFRVNATTRVAIDQAARDARLTRGSYIRTTLVKACGMAVRRQPGFEEAALRPYYVELRRQGGNLNQIAHAANSGKDVHDDVRAIKESVLKTLAAMRRVMGMEE